MIMFSTQADLVNYVQELTKIETYLFEGKKATNEIILIDIVDEINTHANNEIYDYWHVIDITFSTTLKSDRMKINKTMKNAFNCTASHGYDSMNDRVEVTYRTEVKIGEW
jgi:hypothetical protein